MSGHRSHPVSGLRVLRRSSWRRSPEGCAGTAIAGRRRSVGLVGGHVSSRVAVLKVASGQLSVTESAAEHGFSRRHLHRLLALYREGGLDALEPRSRRPRTNPAATSEDVRQRVIELRSQLTADGLDAGPVTIAWHLEREGFKAPAPATIHRILTRAGLIVAAAAQAAPVLLYAV